MNKTVLKFSLLFLALVALGTFFSSCEKIFSHAINFQVDGADIEINVLPNATGYETVETTIPVDLAAMEKEHKFKRANITKIRFVSLSATIVDSDAAPYTFNFLKDIEGDVAASGNANIMTIADYDIERTNETTIGVNIVDVDFSKNIVDDKIYLKFRLTLNSAIKHGFKITAKTAYYIDATTTNLMGK